MEEIPSALIINWDQGVSDRCYKSVMSMEESALIINWDQTSMKLVASSSWTMENEEQSELKLLINVKLQLYLVGQSNSYTRELLQGVSHK